jgi:hypothetical protein
MEGELKGEEGSSVRSHLTECAPCSKALTILQKLGQLGAQAKVFPKEEFFEDTRRSLLEKIRQDRPSQERSFKLNPFRLWKPVLIPVTLSLLLVVGLRLQTGQERQSMRQELALVSELGEENLSVYTEDPDLLEEELAVTDEFLILAQLDTEESFLEEVELLNALGEGEGLDEDDPEMLEEELARVEEGAIG